VDGTSPSIKSLNYLNNILARIEANDRGADEAVMLDAQGYVAEATVDNLFIVTDRELLAPPTATNLKGGTRETLLALAPSPGIRTKEMPFTLFDVWTAREAFICGTAAEIVPILSVDGRTIGDGVIGPVTARIVAEYHKLVRSQGRPIQPSAPARDVVAGYRVWGDQPSVAAAGRRSHATRALCARGSGSARYRSRVVLIADAMNAATSPATATIALTSSSSTRRPASCTHGCAAT